MTNKTDTLTDWLRAELAADREAAAEKTATDWVITAVDTTVALGLLARTMIYSCVYAVNHAEEGAEIAFSLAAEPLEAGCWRFVDRVQASLLGPIAVAWVVSVYGVEPMPPAWLGLLTSNAAVLLVDPVRVVVSELH